MILASCAQPMDLQTVPAETPVEETEEEPVEVWQPAENTVYIFEGENEIFARLCYSRTEYSMTVSAARQTVELHNRDYVTEWTVVSGPCTLEE